MRVFVTGGTGLIGTRLVKRLIGRGDQVEVLTRRYAAARQTFGTAFMPVEGDATGAGEWTDRAAAADAVVNLAGENVFARRWHPAFKQLLVESRVRTTRHVAEAMARAPRRGDGQPKVLVNASAIGIYGPHDFLANLCVEWEKAALAAQAAGVRVSLVRIGVVLDKEGGALAKLLTPFKLFAGGPAGSGKQWMGWIHHEDLTNLLLRALDDPQAAGPLNGTAPNPVRNRDFAKALGAALHRPSFLPTPGLALRLLLGEVADVILTGQRVLPRRPLDLGFDYKFPTVDAALADILR
jgi:uncharacterized protein